MNEQQFWEKRLLLFGVVREDVRRKIYYALVKILSSMMSVKVIPIILKGQEVRKEKVF